MYIDGLGTTGGNISDNREDARPKSKADGVYDNPSPLVGAHPSVYDNIHGMRMRDFSIHQNTKVKLKEITNVGEKCVCQKCVQGTQFPRKFY